MKKLSKYRKRKTSATPANQSRSKSNLTRAQRKNRPLIFDIEGVDWPLTLARGLTSTQIEIIKSIYKIQPMSTGMCYGFYPYGARKL